MQMFLKSFKKLAGRVLLGLKQGAYIEGGETAIGAPWSIETSVNRSIETAYISALV